MRTDWRLIGLLYLVGLFAAGQFAKIALTLDALAIKYPGSAVPFAVSAVSLAGILFGVTAGMVVARFGARTVLLTALFAAAFSSVAQSWLPEFPLFMSLRVFEGFCHLAIVVASPTLMAAVSRGRDVPIAMGLWGTFFGVGFAAAAAVIPLFDGASEVYFAHGVFGFVLLNLLWPLVPRGQDRVLWDGNIIAKHIAIYSSPRLVAPALSFFWHTVMFLGLLTFYPNFLGAWTAPILPLLALVGTFGAGWLARWFLPRDILLVGFGASILLLGLGLLVPDALHVWVVMAAMIVIGLVPGASFANVPALNLNGADRARANGAIAQLGNIGTATSVPLFASVLSYGFAGLTVAGMAISVLGALLVWLIHKRIAKSA